MNTEPRQPGARRTTKDHRTDGGSKARTRETQPTDGAHDQPSARQPFPTVAGAVGIRYGRPPKIPRISGLVKPTQPAHTMIEMQKWQDYTNDAMRYDRINFGGVR